MGHLLLDEQSDQIFATTDDIAERVRKIGGTTLRSIGQGRRRSVNWRQMVLFCENRMPRIAAKYEFD